MQLQSDIVSPFDGTIRHIAFQVGDTVNEGDAVFSIYVDGIEMDILAPACGFVERVEVGLFERVIAGMVLATINESG